MFDNAATKYKSFNSRDHTHSGVRIMTEPYDKDNKSSSFSVVALLFRFCCDVPREYKTQR